MNVTVHVKMNSEHILVFSAKNCNTMDKIYRYKKAKLVQNLAMKKC